MIMINLDIEMFDINMLKKKKSKGNSCSYTSFIVRYENCSDLDVHDLS